MSRIDRLKKVMVYDANSGAWGAVVDSANKILMLKGCPLCSITPGIAGEKSDWKSCREEIGVPVAYIHRDELGGQAATLAQEVGLSCVLAEVGGRLVPLLSPAVLERCRGNVAEFRSKLYYHASAKHLDMVSDPHLGLERLIQAERG
jgi:hypothetical protein